MALTTAFLSTCRTTIGSLAELSTFREALAAVGTGTRAERLAAWTAAYSPTATGQKSSAVTFKTAALYPSPA